MIAAVLSLSVPTSEMAYALPQRGGPATHAANEQKGKGYAASRASSRVAPARAHAAPANAAPTNAAPANAAPANRSAARGSGKLAQRNGNGVRADAAAPAPAQVSPAILTVQTPAPAPAPQTPSVSAAGSLLPGRVLTVSAPRTRALPSRSAQPTAASPDASLIQNEPMVLASGGWQGASLQAALDLRIPILFGAAVLLFVLLQALIDRRDPKVSRAPERGDDDTIGFS